LRRGCGVEVVGAALTINGVDLGVQAIGSIGHSATRMRSSTSKLQVCADSNILNTDGNLEMIIRSLIRAQGPRSSIKHTFRVSSRHSQATRRYSTANAPSMSSSAPQSQASMLATITTDLDKIAPRFEVQPEQIEILRTPAEFYETLKVGFASFSQPCPFPQSARALNDWS